MIAGPPEPADVAAGVVAAALDGEQLDVMVGRSRSTTVRVHAGEVESFTSAETFGIGIRVIRDGRVGFAHAGSIEPAVVTETLQAARDNLPFAAVDDAVGLAEPDGVEPVPLDHWRPSLLDYPTESKIARAVDLERRARDLDPRVTGVRVAAWSDSATEVAFAATNGITTFDRATGCSVGLQPLAEADGETQIGYAGDGAREPGALDDDRVVAEAVDRATRLLGATQPRSRRLPIVLEPRLAATFLAVVAGTLDGESVLKGRSPFADRVGELVAAPSLTLLDDPTRAESLAAASTDGEGLACRATPLFAGGRLEGFLHNSYTARRTGARPTGSALRGPRSLPGVGPQVLVVEPGDLGREAVWRLAGEALYVGSFAGLHSGVNRVSGDFSVGADGLMLRDGELAEPVREVTIASTLQRLLADVVVVGGDAEWLPSGDFVPSLVLGEVAMSGA